MPLESEINKGRERHEKEWGYEDWIENDEAINYCGKLLVLKRQYHCSLHYHKIKEETFYVNKGLVLMEYDGEKIVMTPGNSLRIRREKRHRFTGFSDAEIIEFSTFHRENDSYREQPSGKWTDDEFKQIQDEFRLSWLPKYIDEIGKKFYTQG
ncbi:MAG: cupin domain-containing protein [Candidatus Aenigmarchaeota archaeon]|nr:cupin domain-containing protein [Candidatus Aenigmarchaeota archaeon]